MSKQKQCSKQSKQGCQFQVEHPDSGTVEYAYNGDGLLVEQTVDGSDTTRYVYDGNNRLQETDDIGVTEVDFTYTPGGYGEVISQRRGSDSSFYHFDAIRNVRQLTDDSQVVTDEYQYDAWGKSLASSGSTANSQRYKGELLAYREDPEAAPQPQYALHFRHYDPQTGTFASQDPAEDDINLYRYVKNNPVNSEDPSGLEGPEKLNWLERKTEMNGYAVPENWGGYILSIPEAYIIWPLFGGARTYRAPPPKVPGVQTRVGNLAAESGIWSTDRHKNALEGAKATQDTLAENIPLAGQVYSGGKAITGYNPVLKESLSTTEIVLAGLGAIPAFGAGDDVVDATKLGKRASVASRGGTFGGLVADTTEEASFLRNAATTFREGSVFSSAVRHRGNIVIQRSDIPLSIQNLRRMQSGNSPFVRNAEGEWETLNLHHVGRQDSKLIEVLSSHNTYNPVTGGPLHIPSPGGPLRQSGLSQTYWQKRLNDFISSGQISGDVLRQLER